MQTKGSKPCKASPPASTSPYEWLAGLLVNVGAGGVTLARRDGHPRSQWQCPAHQDSSPSMSMSEGADGKVLLHCHRGCQPDQIVAALSCSMTYLFTAPRHDPKKYAAMRCRGLRFPPMQLHGGGGPANAIHESFHLYGSEWRMERRRTPSGSKVISWDTKDDRGAWIPGIRGATTDTMPLYRERELAQAIALDEPVLLLESESSCDAIKGWYSTTWVGGASTPRIDTIRRVLGGYSRVLVIGDADDAGRECTQKLVDAGLAPHVVFSEVEGEDARDVYDRLGPDGFAAWVAGALEGAS